MSGILTAMLGIVNGIKPQPILANNSVFSRTTVTPTVANTSFTLNTDGSITKGAGTTGPSQWLDIVATGNGNNWWVRAVLVSGAFPNTGTWFQLNAARTFSKTQNVVGFSDGFADIQFSSDGGTTITYTATNVELYAEETN